MSDEDLPGDIGNMCLSGGADGADLLWGMTAGQLGHMVVHWSFAGHRSEAPEIELVELTQEALDEADEACARAAVALHRPFPLRTLASTNLLRRNFYQVKEARACYAVSSLRSDGTVDGGTAWAIQMFIDQHAGPCEAYLFDQNSNHWLQWSDKWDRIETPPRPYGIWAGIGTRKLTPEGRNAIKKLMGYSPQ